jgi:hypothetical protein
MIQNYSQYSDTLKKMEMCTGLGCRGEVKEWGHLAETGTSVGLSGRNQLYRKREKVPRILLPLPFNQSQQEFSDLGAAAKHMEWGLRKKKQGFTGKTRSKNKKLKISTTTWGMQKIHWSLKKHTTMHTPRLILTQTYKKIYLLILNSTLFESDLTPKKCNFLQVWLQKPSVNKERFQKKFIFFFLYFILFHFLLFYLAVLGF